MTKQQAQAFIVLLLIAVVVFAVARKWNRDNNPDDDREEYSYHFGFPTWGAINNSPWSRGWGGVRYNPFMTGYMPWRYNPYGRYYYGTSVRPYLTGRCYTSTEGSDCQPGYRSVGTDTNDDGAKDKWQCCRKWLI